MIIIIITIIITIIIITVHSLVCVLGGGYVVLLEGSVQKP